MQSIKSITNLLKFVLKYAALIAVVVEIIQFAITKLDQIEKNTPSPGDNSSSDVKTT